MDNIKYIDIDLTNVNNINNTNLETIPEDETIPGNETIPEDENIFIEIDNNTGCRYVYIFLGLFISYLVFFIIKNWILNKN